MSKVSTSYDYTRDQGPQMKGRQSRLRTYSTATSRKFTKGRLVTTKTSTTFGPLGNPISSTTTESKSINFLGLIVLILLFATVAAILTGSNEPKTFVGFLEMLTTIPEVNIPWHSIDIVGLALPDWMSWAQPILVFFQSLVTVGAFFVNGIWQAIKIAFWIIQWLFF